MEKEIKPTENNRGLGDDFKLAPEVLDKIGMNPDYSEKDSISDDNVESGADYNMGLSEEIGTIDEMLKDGKPVAPEDKKPEEKVEIPADKDVDKTIDKDNPDKDENKDKTEEVEKGDEFQKSIQESLKTFDTPDKRSQLLKDLKNYENFMASNTQKSQSIADERKAFNELVSNLGLEEVTKVVADELFMEALDDWFDPDKAEGERDKTLNPFRKLPEMLNYSKSVSEESQKTADANLEKEIKALVELDESYKEQENLIKLGEVADRKGVNLIIAHELKVSNDRAQQITTLSDEVKTLKVEIDRYKKELKDRNIKLTDKRAKEPLEEETVPGADGSGADEFAYKNKSNSFEETSARLLKKIGV